MTFRFPLPDTHAGILMGNGLFGVAVWGVERLCLTINRADYWDRRESRGITGRMNYRDQLKCWQAGDLDGISRMVDEDETVPIEVATGLPMGRIELGVRIESASLHLADGVLELKEKASEAKLRLAVAADEPLLLIETDRTDLELRCRPAWEFLGDHLASIGHEPPRMFEHGALSGWFQKLPADPCLCLACTRLTGGLAVTAVYGDTEDDARTNAEASLKRVGAGGIDGLIRSTQRWWQDYWAKIPKVELPSKDAEQVYYFGLFKLAAMTKEHVALLQGPWVEEYQMPDCSNDLHFNINVQMCYWPVYAANCLELLDPLLEKLAEWAPRLRRNAELVYGLEDGIFLPMSVGDEGQWLANFWPSFTDFATTGWTAHLLWLRYRYSMDTEFLRRTAYPFMKGAMRIYDAVLQERDGRMMLPMSTSPEYRWSAGGAVGANASFQFACIHFLLEALIAAAEVLDVDAGEAAAWRELKEKVPPWTTTTRTTEEAARLAERQGPGADLDAHPRIAIFEGQDLEFSHRHHAHLGAIHPFDTLESDDVQTDRLLEATLRHWVEVGTGNWIAFSFSHASIIYSRLKQGEAAYLHYELWHRLFANEHGGAVELSHTPGLTTWTIEQRSSPMQMDAYMGAITAIQEMLLHTVRGTMTVFPALPRAWQSGVAFERMRAEGAFLVSARVRDGRITEVEILSEKGAALRMTNNIADEIMVRRGDGDVTTRADVLTLQTEPGETITIRAAGPHPGSPPPA